METITVRICPEESWFVAHCLEYDIASQGETQGEALKNIKEAARLFLETASQEEIENRQKQFGHIEQLSLGGA